MNFANEFQNYINNLDKCKELLLFNDDNILIIKDKYPKSIRHYLIIPKSSRITHVHPLDVFDNIYDDYSGVDLYELLKGYVDKAKDLIIKDLSESLNCKDQLKLDELKNNFIVAGVHSIPSLKNLHIHVMTKDFHSPCLKNKKHYNSFTTKFFVPFEELNPLYNEKYYKLVDKNEENVDSESDFEEEEEEKFDEDEKPKFIRHTRGKAFLDDMIKNTPFKCTSCSKTFGNSMVNLKNHLAEEFNRRYNKLGNASNLKPNDS
ncbi:unnamed protein product [Candida verbasci]|uniref:Aprataxin C2HE/C2H2/C2HC zinc finger domain-containing protein n=1 Tax=Candida verbasci TaxID=1227364 RepID=A0A9W4TQW8_9ASCO|nr:unnamed protein product [Candida verbasci]